MQSPTIIAHQRDFLGIVFVGTSPAWGAWPFPPPGGPVPWTAKQRKQYERQEREKLPPAPY